MNNFTKIVIAALNAIERQDPAYAERMFAQRLPEGGMGSVYPDFHSREELEAALRNANYHLAEHPAIAPMCVAFVTTDLNGEYGMELLSNLPDDVQLRIEDPKNTGKVSLVVEGGHRIATNETWVIIGPNDNEDVVYTFHPGQPVPRATTSTEALPVGTVLTKAEAIKLGFNMAKVC